MIIRSSASRHEGGRLTWEPSVETVACDLCGALEGSPVAIAGDTRYGTPGSFPIVRCRRCGLVYLNPRPDAASLGRYYPETYAPHSRTGQHGSRVGRAFRQLAFGAGRLARTGMAGYLYNVLAFRAFVAAERPGTVLDVGCGPGDYLRVWKDLGWETEGVEPSPAAAETARRVAGRVHLGLIDSVELAPGAYDLITMSHSLEHTPSPRRALGKLREALRPGGRLLVMVPNFAAFDRRLFGPHWFGLEVPRHLYHFEPSTLRATIEAAGLRVVRMSGSAHPSVLVRSARSMAGASTEERDVTRVEKLLATAVLFPLAIARRSTSLWAVAERPSS